MINLTLPTRTDAQERFVVQLRHDAGSGAPDEAVLMSSSRHANVYASRFGLFELSIIDDDQFDGDIIAVDPRTNTVERLIRRNSNHNTFLVTERCDQLCVMCSQPPKKTHVDRWEEFKKAALLADQDAVLGISGGEPTLYKQALFEMIDDVLSARPDLSFHILSNGQHFEETDLPFLSSGTFRKVTWGIPLYSHDAQTHDLIVAKEGAHQRLKQSFAVLLRAGAHIELRTVLLSSNIGDLPQLSRYVTGYMGFIDQWSIMQLENIGFARNRFRELLVDVVSDFAFIAEALDRAELHGVPVAMFNVPRCSLPTAYRRYAVNSISDWKQKYAPACAGCSERALCAGFFAWQPDDAMKVSPL